jgi:WhiB family transcriptional regulator, redox-sensing transcriptional regulator
MLDPAAGTAELAGPRGSTEGWRGRAACRGAGPALFYDPDPAAVAAAKQVCATCPARAPCAAHALTTGEAHGVWGGLTEDERRTRPARSAPGPGPASQLSDDEICDLFGTADPDRPAVDQLLEHITVASATAYKYLERARRLGVVEERGRRLFPVRR